MSSAQARRRKLLERRRKKVAPETSPTGKDSSKDGAVKEKSAGPYSPKKPYLQPKAGEFQPKPILSAPANRSNAFMTLEKRKRVSFDIDSVQVISPRWEEWSMH